MAPQRPPKRAPCARKSSSLGIEGPETLKNLSNSGQTRTLQLLPKNRRISYAGRTVELREQLDGRLVAVYRGEIISTSEIPSRRSPLQQGTWTVGSAGSGDWERLAKRLSSIVMESANVASQPPIRRRLVTRRMVAYWEAVQEAKSRGLSIRAITTELGISRNTVRKYLRAPYPLVGTSSQVQCSVTTELTESLNT